MDENRFLEIFDDDENDAISWEGDNAVTGLNIIQKYMPSRGIEGASHDVIFSVSVSELVAAGITEEDAKQLRLLNWMIEEGEYLACFV